MIYCNDPGTCQNSLALAQKRKGGRPKGVRRTQRRLCYKHCQAEVIPSTGYSFPQRRKNMVIPRRRYKLRMDGVLVQKEAVLVLD